MFRRTRIFVLLIAVALVTIWYWQRHISARNEGKISTLQRFARVNCSKSDGKFDSVKVRIYLPVTYGHDDDDALRPGVAYYHGGGWVRGMLDSRDASLLRLCSETGAIIISVDYRLAPNVTFPVPFEDCLKATQYFFSHAHEFGVDTKRLAVAGDSAGGNLAAAVAIKLRDERFHPQPKLQLLLYPVLQGIDFQLPSMLENRAGPRLTAGTMCYFVAMYLEGSGSNWNKYCNNSHVEPGVLQLYARRYLNVDALPAKYRRRNHSGPAVRPRRVDRRLWDRLRSKLLSPYFSPLLADSVAGLPQTFVLTLERDPLRDEALLYLLRLTEAGVRVTHVHQSGYHGDLPARLHELIQYTRTHL